MKEHKFLFFLIMAFYITVGTAVCGFLFLKGSSLHHGSLTVSAFHSTVKPELSYAEQRKPAAKNETEQKQETNLSPDKNETEQKQETNLSPDKNETADEALEEAEPVYYSFTVVPVTALHVRKEPGTQAEISFRLMTNAAGIVLEKGEKWSLIQSAEGSGYVYNQYIKFTEITQEEYLSY